MDKSELYNAVVKITRATGQGLALKFARMMTGWDRDFLDELVEEGYLKVITHRYGWLPDDDWICLTNVYCVEEDMNDDNPDGNRSALTFLRFFLNIDETLPGTNLTCEDVVRENYEEYRDWVAANLDDLNAIRLLQEAEMEDALTDEAIEFLVGRKWYKENKTVAEAESSCNEAFKLFRELEFLNKQIFDLYEQSRRNGSDKHVEKEKEEKEKFKQDKKKNKLRRRVARYLANCEDKNTPVQEFYADIINKAKKEEVVEE